MSSNRLLYMRNFLNTEEEEGTAFVEARVMEMQQSDDGSRHCNASFTLSDCNRMVTLDFDVWGADNVPALRSKVSRLRRAIVAFEKVLLAQYTEVEKEQKRR